jgi:hypothetical protein
MHHRGKNRAGRILFCLRDIADASHHPEKDAEKQPKQRSETPRQRGAVVRHTSKALRPPEAEWTGASAGEGKGTLDGSCGHRLLIASPASGHVPVQYLDKVETTDFKLKGVCLFAMSNRRSLNFYNKLDR